MGDLKGKAAMSTSHTVQLLPCPFCGGPAGIRGDFGLQGLNCLDHSGECPGAQVSLPAHTPQRRREAIAAWNRRASLPAVQGEQPRTLNDWFLSLPEGRQAVLRDDKWMLADAAFQAGLKASQAARTSSVAAGRLPSAQPNAKDGLVDPVVPTTEPPGATLSPGAASQWISVDARLPDDPAQECLVYWGTSFGKPLYGIATLSTPWKGELLWHGHRGSHSDVTLWQPITPPTYQVEQGESSSKGGESNG